MKNILVVLMLASLFTGSAFAEEVATDCPWMKEENSRNNPKANLGSQSQKQAQAKPKTSSTTRQ